MLSLADHTLSSLQQLLLRWGYKPAHATTLLRHYYDQHGQLDLPRLDLGHSLTRQIQSELSIPASTIDRRVVAADGTIKLLLRFADGHSVEAVLMPSHRPDRAAGCVSSQVGCAMRCDFCASTRQGVQRDLSTGEIVEQFLHLRREAAAVGRRLNSLVFMGMGEPMLNLPAVLPALRCMIDPRLGALGPKHITVSTVGIVPGIDQLAESHLNVHLALSLHAADDALRTRIVPMNRKYPIADLLAATARYQLATGRIPTIEYCLLAGVNDSSDQAAHLADLLTAHAPQGLRAHVNVIPYNPIGLGLTGIAYRQPAPDIVQQFLQQLHDRQIIAHIRSARGDDVMAACGQLATAGA